MVSRFRIGANCGIRGPAGLRFPSFCSSVQSFGTRSSSLPISADKRTNLIFGANTDVGKTIVSAGLVRASLSRGNRDVHYIKPLQCGGSDERFVRHHVQTTDDVRLSTQILFQWETPTSPHKASILEGLPRSDQQVLDALQAQIASISRSGGSATTYIETAGGVLSPSCASPENNHPKHAQTVSSDQPTTPDDSSRTWGWVTQGDLYQPILGHAPVVLVGDGRLGGISCTLSALESLIVRGYDIAALILLETEASYDNISALREYVSRKSFRLRTGSGDTLFPAPSQSLLSLPPIPSDPQVPLHDWYASDPVKETFSRLDDYLQNSWEGQVSDLRSVVNAGEGRENAVWWPDFADDSEGGASYVDSATAEHLHVITMSDDESVPLKLEKNSLFDATASWWTRGVGHGESSMALAAAAAAGRYGHVSGNVVHAPAVTLAQTLVGPNGPGYPWADRVLFTDDGGSTAVEAALKMGIQTYQKRMSLSADEADKVDWIVAAQEDCFHGDTLGAVNVAEAYLDRQHPWYQQKSLCLAPPTLGYRDGVLSISLPEGMQPAEDVKYEFDSIRQAMDIDARSLPKMKSLYKEMVEIQWLVHEHSTQQKIGSVIMEPLLLCTGGMKFIDPLWQRAMAEVAQSRNIPVIFDESTSGLYRLGVKSCREILRIDPDIAIYSKLLTGGVVPLSAVVAKEEVFEAVTGGEVGQSLINGNTFVANPVACVAAQHALAAYSTIAVDEEEAAHKAGPRLLFDEAQTKALSKLSCVEQSFTLGTVLSVSLHPDDGGDSGGDRDVSRADQVVGILKSKGVLAHLFGDTFYVMTSPLVRKDECAEVLNLVHKTVEKLSRE